MGWNGKQEIWPKHIKHINILIENVKWKSKNHFYKIGNQRFILAKWAWVQDVYWVTLQWLYVLHPTYQIRYGVLVIHKRQSVIAKATPQTFHMLSFLCSNIPYFTMLKPNQHANFLGKWFNICNYAFDALRHGSIYPPKSLQILYM